MTEVILDSWVYKCDEVYEPPISKSILFSLVGFFLFFYFLFTPLVFRWLLPCNLIKFQFFIESKTAKSLLLLVILVSFHICLCLTSLHSSGKLNQTITYFWSDVYTPNVKSSGQLLQMSYIVVLNYRKFVNVEAVMLAISLVRW